MALFGDSQCLLKTFNDIKTYLENIVGIKYSEVIVITALKLWGIFMKTNKINGVIVENIYSIIC